MKKEDIYISILEYGMNKAGMEGTRPKDIYKLAREKGYLNEQEYQDIIKPGNDHNLSVDIHQKMTFLQRAFHAAFSEHVFKVGKNSYSTNFFSLDSYLKYLEYQELQMARKNAREARLFSIGALIIALFSIYVTVFIPIDIKNPVLIENKALDSIESKVDSIRKHITAGTETTPEQQAQLHQLQQTMPTTAIWCPSRPSPGTALPGCPFPLICPADLL